MKKEDLKNQLLSGTDTIIDIVSKGNIAEIKKNKDGIAIFEVTRKKAENETK